MVDDRSLAEKAAESANPEVSQTKVATGTAPSPSPTAAPANDAESRGLSRFVPLVIFSLAALVFFVIVSCWNSWNNTFFLKTDDAYVRADVAPLSTRERGIVSRTCVTDYQKVQAGQLLIELRNEDFKDRTNESKQAVSEVGIKIEDMKSRKAKLDAQVLDAQAQLENSREALHQFDATIEIAKANIEEANANLEASAAAIKQSDASVESAKSDMVKTGKAREREEALLKEESSTKEKVEQVVDEYDRSQAALQSQLAARLKATAEQSSRKAQVLKAKQQLSSAMSDKLRAATGVKSREAEVTARTMERKLLDGEEKQLQTNLISKKADVDSREIDMGYTSIKAPVAGTIGEVKVKAGQFVNAGTQVATLISAAPWVIANFRETQTAKVKVGDNATVEIDALPGKHWLGHVESIAPASGAQFSLLPPDNASGNFTKITQRIPVKVIFDNGNQDLTELRPGMSASVSISPKAK